MTLLLNLALVALYLTVGTTAGVATVLAVSQTIRVRVLATIVLLSDIACDVLDELGDLFAETVEALEVYVEETLADFSRLVRKLSRGRKA